MNDTNLPAKEALNSCIKEIIDCINNQTSVLSNRKLVDICIGNGIKLTEFNPHLQHELLETAVNFIIKTRYAVKLEAELVPLNEIIESINEISRRLPTQSWRSDEQILRQQFSTPPAIGCLLAYLLNSRKGELVLEPSAGTGSLAVCINNDHERVLTNEIEARRRLLLETLGYQPFAFNAEFIDDYLPPEYRPDAVIMNPPFSSNGGRTENNSSKYGFRHVESAIRRLKPGGKFAVILGAAAGFDTKTGLKFWNSLAPIINLKSIIKIAGRSYSKNGTSVDINLITGRKREFMDSKIERTETGIVKTFFASTVAEALQKAGELQLRLN